AQGSLVSGRGVITISDSHFTGNRAAQLGGALYFAGQNELDAGGSTDSYLNVTVQRSLFDKNTASYGGALFGWGFAGNSKHPIAVKNSTFVENSSSSYGGAVGAVGGIQLTVEQDTFFNNTTAGADGGGAIFLRDTASKLT